MAERKPKKKEPVPVKKPRARRKKVEIEIEPVIEQADEKTPDNPHFGVWLAIVAVAAIAIAIIVN